MKPTGKYLSINEKVNNVVKWRAISQVNASIYYLCHVQQIQPCSQYWQNYNQEQHKRLNNQTTNLLTYAQTKSNETIVWFSVHEIHKMYSYQAYTTAPWTSKCYNVYCLQITRRSDTKESTVSQYVRFHGTRLC